MASGPACPHPRLSRGRVETCFLGVVVVVVVAIVANVLTATVRPKQDQAYHRAYHRDTPKAKKCLLPGF